MTDTPSPVAPLSAAERDRYVRSVSDALDTLARIAETDGAIVDPCVAHDARERFRVLLAEAREQLQESRDECDDHIHAVADREAELAKEKRRSDFLEEELDLREASRDSFVAELAACRRERDTWERAANYWWSRHPDNAGKAAQHQSAPIAGPGQTRDTAFDDVGSTLPQHQSAPSEREAPAPVDPVILRDLAATDAMLDDFRRRYPDAPKPAEATGAELPTGENDDQ